MTGFAFIFFLLLSVTEIMIGMSPKKNLKQYSENIKYVYRDPDCDCSSSLLKTTIKNLWNI